MLTVLIDYAAGNLHSAEKAFQRMARETDAGEVIVSGKAEDGSIVEFPGPKVKRIAGMPILDNHGVNLLSCTFTAMLIPQLALNYMV